MFGFGSWAEKTLIQEHMEARRASTQIVTANNRPSIVAQPAPAAASATEEDHRHSESPTWDLLALAAQSELYVTDSRTRDQASAAPIPVTVATSASASALASALASADGDGTGDGAASADTKTTPYSESEFHLCGTQFDAYNDIEIHKDRIVEFIRDGGRTVVLRYFNFLPKKHTDTYQAEATTHITQILEAAGIDNPAFNVIIKDGRDESLTPIARAAAHAIDQQNRESIARVTRLLHSLPAEPRLELPTPKATRHPLERDVVGSFNDGHFTIPAELTSLLCMSPAQLTAIADGTDKVYRSQKPFRSLALLSRTYPKIFGSLCLVSPPELNRFNSDGRNADGSSSVAVACTTRVICGNAVQTADLHAQIRDRFSSKGVREAVFVVEDREMTQYDDPAIKAKFSLSKRTAREFRTRHSTGELALCALMNVKPSENEIEALRRSNSYTMLAGSSCQRSDMRAEQPGSPPNALKIPLSLLAPSKTRKSGGGGGGGGGW